MAVRLAQGYMDRFEDKRASHERAVVSKLAAMLGLAACTCGEEGDIPTIESHIAQASRRR